MSPNKLLFFLLCAGGLCAQPKLTAMIEPVAQNGLHSIYLPSRIVSASEFNFADLRIYDSRNNEVPYLVQPSDNVTANYQFKPFHIVSKTTVPKKSTSIVVEPEKKELTEITLYIANAEVTKKFSISGSNDEKQWFGLVDGREMQGIENVRSTSEYKTIPLPRNSYRYLRIDLDDRKTLPLNVLQAGYFESDQKTERRFEDLQPSKIETSHDKTSKRTTIHVVFEYPQAISRIGFAVSAPNFFNRQGRIYKNVRYKIKKREEIRQHELSAFELGSDKRNEFYTSGLSEKEFYIEIDNRDNPPLEFSKIGFSYLQNAIAADLKANETYTLKAGNKKLDAPDYDLSRANPKMYQNLPEARLTPITYVTSEVGIAETNPKSFWQQSWFMWLCISVGGLMIAYFTKSLVRDMK